MRYTDAFESSIKRGLHYAGIAQRFYHIFRQRFALGEVAARYRAAIYAVGKQQNSKVGRFHVFVNAAAFQIVAAVGLYIYTYFPHTLVLSQLVKTHLKIYHTAQHFHVARAADLATYKRYSARSQHYFHVAFRLEVFGVIRGC